MYGDKGRWAPVEMYIGTIVCENVISFKEISKHGQNFTFDISKPFLSSNKILTIESEMVGKLEIKCKRIVPQKYDIFFFSKSESRWVLRSYAVENLDSYLNGTIDNYDS